jgi:hypothetical protein
MKKAGVYLFGIDFLFSFLIMNFHIVVSWEIGNILNLHTGGESGFAIFIFDIGLPILLFIITIIIIRIINSICALKIVFFTLFISIEILFISFLKSYNWQIELIRGLTIIIDIIFIVYYYYILKYYFVNKYRKWRIVRKDKLKKIMGYCLIVSILLFLFLFVRLNLWKLLCGSVPNVALFI